MLGLGGGRPTHSALAGSLSNPQPTLVFHRWRTAPMIVMGRARVRQECLRRQATTTSGRTRLLST